MQKGTEGVLPGSVRNPRRFPDRAVLKADTVPLFRESPGGEGNLRFWKSSWCESIHQRYLEIFKDPVWIH